MSIPTNDSRSLPPEDRPLSARQRTFALEYLECGNALKSARAAGYAAEHSSSGHAILQQPNVQKFLRTAIRKQEEELHLTAERILLKLLQMADADIGDIYDEMGKPLPVSAWPVAFRRCIAGTRTTWGPDGEKVVTPLLPDRVAVLKVLAQHLGLLTKRVEVSGPFGGPIQVEDSGAALLAKIVEIGSRDDAIVLPGEPVPALVAGSPGGTISG